MVPARASWVSRRPSLSWTWVVASSFPAAMVSVPSSAEMWACPVSSARASRRPVELAEQVEQLAHPAARMNARGHVLDADDDAAPFGMCRQLEQSAGQACASRRRIGRLGKPARMNDQVRSARGLQPVHALLQIVHRLAMDDGSVSPGPPTRP